jgi:nucleotide-binding universal stress UspA family protein
MPSSPVAIQRILCPTDFSIFSARALRHAAALAHKFRAELAVLHVIPLFQPYGSISRYFPEPPMSGTALWREAEDEMVRFMEPVLDEGLALRGLVREGRPPAEIEAAAGLLSADLVVMGTHGRSGLGRFGLGSVTETTIHKLPCPVLTVCQEEGRTWDAPGLVERILCAVDLSPASAHTLEYALALADAYGARVTVLHVLPPEPPSESGPERVGEGELTEQQASVALRRCLSAAVWATGKVEERLLSGRPDREILRVAVAERADLIVMGSHEGHALGRAVLGWTSHCVVRRATCPVLVVRPTASGPARPAEGTRALVAVN